MGELAVTDTTDTPIEDYRVENTIDAIEDRLIEGDGLVRRYDATDGLPGEEGAFVLETGAHLGNYPQAFSHVGLVNSALYLGYVTGYDLPGAEPMGSVWGSRPSSRWSPGRPLTIGRSPPGRATTDGTEPSGRPVRVRSVVSRLESLAYLVRPRLTIVGRCEVVGLDPVLEVLVAFLAPRLCHPVPGPDRP